MGAGQEIKVDVAFLDAFPHEAFLDGGGGAVIDLVFGHAFGGAFGKVDDTAFVFQGLWIFLDLVKINVVEAIADAFAAAAGADEAVGGSVKPDFFAVDGEAFLSAGWDEVIEAGGGLDGACKAVIDVIFGAAFALGAGPDAESDRRSA